MATVAIASPSPASMDSKKADAPSIAVSEIKQVAATPTGFKLVKVKKPDGTVVTVKRPINQDAKKTSSTGLGQVAVPKPVAIPQINQASLASKSTTESTPAPAATAAIVAKTTASETSRITVKAPETAPKSAPKSVPVSPVTSPQNGITPKALVADLPNTTAPAPLPTKTKEAQAASSAPAKKKWYSGISKGVSSLNVDKIVTTLDSIEQATTRIDAALSGKPIPPKKAAPSSPAATVSAPKPVASSSPAPNASTTVLKNAIAKPASTGLPGATKTLVSTQSEPAKANPQTSGSTQPTVVIAKTPTAPVAALPAAQASKIQASPVPASVVQTTPRTIQSPRAGQAPSPTQAKTGVPSATTKAAAPKSAPTPAHHSVASEALLATVGTSATIGTGAAVHAAQKPALGNAPKTRPISERSSSGQQSQYPDQNATAYPPSQSGYQNDTTPDSSGNDYTGLAAGAIGGAALGVGGDMAYEEYEEYQSGDEVVEGDLEDGDVPADIDEAGEAEDEVFEDYNPDEDEVVGDDAVDEAGVEEGHESDEVVEDYDPEQDEVVDDDNSDHGEPAEPVEAEVEPAVEYAQSDPGQPEEPEHEVAEEHDVDVTQNPSDDEHNVDDDDDY